MKRTILVLPVLIAVASLTPLDRCAAQKFTLLHNLAGAPTEGANPYSGLVLSSNRLYGTTFNGGSNSVGTIFAINNDGSGFTNLHIFTASTDGSHPQTELVLSGNMLYGTTAHGGLFNSGTVFAVSTNGTVFTNLHNFTGSEGANPQSGMVLSGGTLYGLAPNGGSGQGTLFAINTDGSSFTKLHEFGGSDGSFPDGGLILSGDTLLGTASQGSAPGIGVVFTIKTNGTGYTGYQFS